MLDGFARWAPLVGLVTLGFTACARVQDRYVATPLGEAGAPAERREVASGVVISGEELVSYGSEYFGMLQVTFENPSADWVRIEKLTLDFGSGERNAAVSFPEGPEINAWLSATLQRNVIRDTNEALALGTLLAIGTTVARIGAASDRREVAAASGAVALGSAAALAADAELDELDGAGDVQPYPDSHLLALPLEIPPGLFAKRWVLLNTQRSSPCIRSVRLVYEVANAGPERVLLQFRRRNDRSEWQKHRCARAR